MLKCSFPRKLLIMAPDEIRHCQPLRKVIFSVRMPELYIRCQTCFISDTASDEAVIMHKDLDRWSSCVDC